MNQIQNTFHFIRKLTDLVRSNSVVIFTVVMSAGFFMCLFINDFLPQCLLVSFNLLFYDWRECVVSVHGTTKHSLCKYIDT